MVEVDRRRQELLRWAEALSSVARTGLGFTENTFEAERYEEVLHIAADIRAAAEAENSADNGSTGPQTGEEWYSTWREMVGSNVAGYVTPKVAVGAIVGDDDGRLLLIQRADSGVWLYPTGWADVGYSPSEVVVKEVHEETGIECEVFGLLGVVDGMRHGFSAVPLYSLLFGCRAVGGELTPHPVECLDVGWFDADDLPEPLVGFERWGQLAFDAINGRSPQPVFDPPRNPVWRTGQ